MFEIGPRTLAAIAGGALILFTPAVGRADPPPLPPPNPLIPGQIGPLYGYLNGRLLAPTITDSPRGTGISTNADPAQTTLGLPGEDLPNSPTRSARIAPILPSSAVQIGGNSAGVSIGTSNGAAGLEDPNGNPPANPTPGNESTITSTPLPP